jgi:three-Cys-motif partner protein
MGDTSFWAVPKDWSQRKHAVINYYLKSAINKFIFGSATGGVVVLDGFAGRGEYEDGTPGSPVIIGKLAEEQFQRHPSRDLRVWNIELNHENFSHLIHVTEPWVQRGYVTNLQGSFQDHLPTVLKNSGQSLLFAFLDPYRPRELAFADFAPLLERQSQTELCIVFFSSIIQRHLVPMLPAANVNDRFRQARTEHLNRIFGDGRWQRLIDKESLSLDNIVECYIEGILDRARLGCTRWQPDVFVCYHQIYARVGKDKKYHIIFVTRHIDGVELMNDTFVHESGLLFNEDDIKKFEKSGRQMGFGFEEFDQNTQRFNDGKTQLMQYLIEIGRREPSRKWLRDDLIAESIKTSFGKYQKTVHRHAVQSLVDQHSLPKFKPVDTKKKRDGTWQLGPKTLLVFEQ